MSNKQAVLIHFKIKIFDTYCEFVYNKVLSRRNWVITKIRVSQLNAPFCKALNTAFSKISTNDFCAKWLSVLQQSESARRNEDSDFYDSSNYQLHSQN